MVEQLKKYPQTALNIIVFPIMMIANFADQIFKQQSLLERAFFTVPFLIFILLCIYFRKKYKFNAYLLMVMSVLSLLGTEEAGNITGVAFLMISLYQFQTLKTNYILLISTMIVLVSKIFVGFSAMQILIMIIGYIYVLGQYFIMIHPKPPRITAELEEETIEILQYLIAGLKPKEISVKVNLSTEAVNKQIQRARDKMEVGNNEQMIYLLSKNGQISQ